MERLLEGVTVLDVSFYLPGPFASARLAGMGADVLKIEPPGGDPAMHMSGGLVHGAINGEKRIIMLDLKSEQDGQRMRDLIMTADVLIESFRPGVMERLGFDYETVKKIKPDLIYCSLSGYGQAGPLSGLGSHDLNYLALSGALVQMAGRDRAPATPANTFADYTGGLAASEKILAALFRREKTGSGAYLDVALADTPAEFQPVHDCYGPTGTSSVGIPEISGASACYSVYRTKDGRYVALAALEEKFWRNFCEFAGEPEWHPRAFALSGSPEYEEVADFFRTKTLAEWTEISLQTDCCLTPVLEAHERHSHPYFRQRKSSGENKITK